MTFTLSKEELPAKNSFMRYGRMTEFTRDGMVDRSDDARYHPEHLLVVLIRRVYVDRVMLAVEVAHFVFCPRNMTWLFLFPWLVGQFATVLQSFEVECMLIRVEVVELQDIELNRLKGVGPSNSMRKFKLRRKRPATMKK